MKRQKEEIFPPPFFTSQKHNIRLIWFNFSNIVKCIIFNTRCKKKKKKKNNEYYFVRTAWVPPHKLRMSRAQWALRVVIQYSSSFVRRSMPPRLAHYIPGHGGNRTEQAHTHDTSSFMLCNDEHKNPLPNVLFPHIFIYMKRWFDGPWVWLGHIAYEAKQRHKVKMRKCFARVNAKQFALPSLLG